MQRFMLIKTSDDFGMGGSSCTELYCTILRDASLSLRTCVNQYEYGRFFSKSIRGIKVPQQFLEALEEMEGISSQYTVDEVLEALFAHIPLFAIHTKVFIRFSESKLGQDFFHKAYPLVKRINVDLPNDFFKATSFFDAIYHYVQVWLTKHENLPSGEHQVLNRSIIFSSSR